jgi:PAS domain S-box-containing protein
LTILRRLARWAGAHPQVLGLSFLLAVFAALVVWFFATFVPERREAAIEGWNRELSLRADVRRDLLDRRVLDSTEDLRFVATFPSVRALLTPGLSEEAASIQAAHLSGILGSYLRSYRERSISILDSSGRVLASDGVPASGEALALAANVIRSGAPGVSVSREPGLAAALVSAAPVRGDEAGAGRLPVLGAVLAVSDAAETLFDLLGRPVPTSSAEALLVREEGKDILFVSPLRFRPDPPLSFRLPLATAGLAAGAALSEKEAFRAFVDYRGARVYAAVRRLANAPWSLVVKVDEGEALAAFRKEVRQKGITWGALLVAVFAAAAALWRSFAISHEASLARSEASFRNLFEHANDAVFIVGSDGKILDANWAAEENYGARRAALVGRDVADFRPADQRARARANFEEAGRVGRLVFEGEHLRADGSRFPVQVSTRRVDLAGDRFHLSIVRDVTEQKRAEEELRKAEERLRSLFDSSVDAIVSADEDGRIVGWNRSAERMFGYSAAEVTGQPVMMVVPHRYRDRHRAGLAHVKSGGEPHVIGKRVEMDGLRRDGAEFPLEFSLSAWKIASDRFYTAIIRDNTERRRLEAQLLQAQKMEAVGRLAGGVAHDFNNLLTVIQGYGELLQVSLEGDPEKRESVAEIVKAAERAAALTRQLLAFSRRQVLETRVLDLGAVVAELEKMLKRLIGEDVEVVVVIPPGLGRVKADSGQIEQVVLNLAVNARDAMPGGGRLTLELADVDLDAPLAAANDAIPPGRYVVISMSDSGSGMDAETLDHIFEPFFTTKEKGKGTGLGLATVYGIVRQTGGYVAVETAPGAGTTFRIYLPRCSEAAEEGRGSAVLDRHGVETVLLVEDEPAVRTFVQAVLERRGYSVLVAENGAAALDVVTRDARPIHVLLTDLVMPGMNGRELASHVLALRPSLKVVFMSGYTAEFLTGFDVKAGQAFLSKPFSERALAAKLREVLEAPPA